MFRAVLRYAILAFLLVCALSFRTSAAWRILNILSRPAAFPDAPVSLKPATRTIESRELYGNQLLAVDGKPLNSLGQFEQTYTSKHPGDRLLLTLSAPDGHAFEQTIALPSLTPNFSTFGQIALAICTSLGLPLLFLSLGALVVALRPADGSAWLLLFLMISFSETLALNLAPRSILQFAWTRLWASQWPVFMTLLAVRFPERSLLDTRRPWLKYLLLIPCVALTLLYSSILIVWFRNINLAETWRPSLAWLYPFQTLVAMLAIATFFASLGVKAGTAKSADHRRRLRILLFGSSIGLSPVFVAAFYSLATRGEHFAGIPPPLVIVALGFLPIFPLTLAWVIVARRAPDLRYIIRQSVRYATATLGLWLVRGALILMAVDLFRRAGADSRSAPATLVLAFVMIGLGIFVFRQRTSARVSQWVDRRLFREANRAEESLTALAAEASRFFEIGPLLHQVSLRVSRALHVPDLVILIREGEYFVPRFSTRPGEPMQIPVDSRIAQALRNKQAPLSVYFDQPPPWILALNAEELQTLDFMRTQHLLPIFGSGRLAGILSLGPKQSDVPYSPTDIRLLQAVAAQMALALENARVTASLTAEAAEPERANRELEIARDVQARLFPQVAPTLPGLDCAGCCRPAPAIGGDYYDFLPLPDGKLGLAIGDVSGKGIAAALLTASLQTSLRGQTLAGLQDLSALMANVNRQIYEASGNHRYASLFYGEYDPRSRLLTFVNAGHSPPVILRGSHLLRLAAGGPVVGLLPGAAFESDRIALLPGDIFIAYTDGLSEALNDQQEEWDETRLLAAARECTALTARQMVDFIFRSADTFTGSAKPLDDRTLVVVKLAN